MEGLIQDWTAAPESRIVHVERVPARAAVQTDLDPPVPEALGERLADLGVDRLFRHQARAIASVRSGSHTVVVAGTASGKSLCYQIPILESLRADAPSTALLLYPTKALAQDQLRSIHRLADARMVEATYDGDTDRDQRAWVRKHANVVLTNPDMLHVGILP